MESERIVCLLRDVGKLKRLARTGWIESGVCEPESVADHSYRTALLSMILADVEGLDTLVTVRMALIHDLAESRVGDLTPKVKEQTPEWEQEERSTIHDILSQLPKTLAEFYERIWEEYQEGETPEAKLVKSADKLEMLLQARDYLETGSDAKKLMRFNHVSVKGEIEQELEKEIKRSVGVKRC